MEHNKLKSVLNRFISEVSKAQRLIYTIKFPKKDFELIVELSYLKAYLAWERFLEETFILFLLGYAPSQKNKIIRYVAPKNRKHAIEFLLQGKDYIDWSTPEEIRNRANLLLKNGKPFDKPVSSITHQLKNMKTIRNAITHASSISKEKFKSLVRGKISYFPSSLTIGGFLYSRVPNTKPPESFFDYYFNSIINAARKIIKER